MRFELPGYLKRIVIAVFLVIFTIGTGLPQHKGGVSAYTAAFTKAAADAGIIYTYPEDFKENKPVQYEDFRFNYALTLPEEKFEIWFKVTPLKQSWIVYDHARATDKQSLINPDSAYREAGKSIASALSADGDYFERQISDDALAAYNADEGKSYLVSLGDSPVTGHYSYALVVTLQKKHTGNLLAVCLSNDKGAGFFQNVNRLKSCFRFSKY